MHSGSRDPVPVHWNRRCASERRSNDEFRKSPNAAPARLDHRGRDPRRLPVRARVHSDRRQGRGHRRADRRRRAPHRGDVVRQPARGAAARRRARDAGARAPPRRRASRRAGAQCARRRARAGRGRRRDGVLRLGERDAQPGQSQRADRGFARQRRGDRGHRARQGRAARRGRVRVRLPVRRRRAGRRGAAHRRRLRQARRRPPDARRHDRHGDAADGRASGGSDRRALPAICRSRCISTTRAASASPT